MEITSNLEVSVEEETLLDMHSVVNLVNVIVHELTCLADLLDDDDTIESLIDQTVALGHTLRDPGAAERQIRNVDSFITSFEEKLASAIGDRAQAPSVLASRLNLDSILTILRVRAKEIEARHADPDAWVQHSIDQLTDNFAQVLLAIQRNAKGGYQIVSNPNAHHEDNYLIDLKITSIEGKTISMPAVFQDVMRDLLANARKYTPPGGKISASLHNTGQELVFTVEDNGIGIVPDEIEQIVAFGERGSNTIDRQTMGGGFGVTKAWYVTSKFNGRMWIDSPTVSDRGTRIEIRLPVPTELTVAV